MSIFSKNSKNISFSDLCGILIVQTAESTFAIFLAVIEDFLNIMESGSHCHIFVDYRLQIYRKKSLWSKIDINPELSNVCF